MHRTYIELRWFNVLVHIPIMYNNIVAYFWSHRQIHLDHPTWFSFIVSLNFLYFKDCSLVLSFYSSLLNHAVDIITISFTIFSGFFLSITNIFIDFCLLWFNVLFEDCCLDFQITFRSIHFNKNDYPSHYPYAPQREIWLCDSFKSFNFMKFELSTHANAWTKSKQNKEWCMWWKSLKFFLILFRSIRFFWSSVRRIQLGENNRRDNRMKDKFIIPINIIIFRISFISYIWLTPSFRRMSMTFSYSFRIPNGWTALCCFRC